MRGEEPYLTAVGAILGGGLLLGVLFSQIISLK